MYPGERISYAQLMHSSSSVACSVKTLLTCGVDDNPTPYNAKCPDHALLSRFLIRAGTVVFILQNSQHLIEQRGSGGCRPQGGLLPIKLASHPWRRKHVIRVFSRELALFRGHFSISLAVLRGCLQISSSRMGRQLYRELSPGVQTDICVANLLAICNAHRHRV